MNYYIFRHAQTYFSKLDIQYNEHIETAEILPEGIPVIKRLAAYLKDIKTDKNFTSPYLRCRQTVDIISKEIGWKFDVDQRLHDHNRYIEPVSGMVGRIHNFFKEVEQKNYQNIAVCTHGYPISTLIQLATKGFVSEKELDSYPKTGVLSIIKNKKIETVDFN
jgi:broad specificity phosphatase PhoE